MTVTLGFVGCGRMGQMAHIANYSEIAGQGDVRLKAVTDLKRSQAEAVASRHGIEQVYDSIDDICADDEIDGVVCIMFWALQVEPTIQLLQAGKHVIVEKPLAGSAAAGRRMVEAAAGAGRHLACGYMKCHDSGVEWARRRILERGAPHQAHLFFAGGDWWANLGEPITTDEPMPAGGDPSDWLPPDLSPSQAKAFTFFINIYSHHLGMLRYLLGRELDLISIDPHGPSETVLFHAGDTQVVLMRSQMACHWWEERLRLVFPDGYLEVCPPSPMARNLPAQVEDYTHGDGQSGSILRPVTGWNWAFKRQAEHFVEVCAGRVDPVVPAEHACRDLELMEQMAHRYPNAP